MNTVNSLIVAEPLCTSTTEAFILTSTRHRCSKRQGSFIYIHQNITAKFKFSDYKLVKAS